MLICIEGAPTAGSARGLPAGSTAGPGSFVRDSFGNGYSCPRGSRGAYRGVARGGSTLITISTIFFCFVKHIPLCFACLKRSCQLTWPTNSLPICKSCGKNH